MISLFNYSKVFNKICIFYKGNSLTIFKEITTKICELEKKYPKIQIYASCSDDIYYLLENKYKIINKSELKKSKNKFAYVKQIDSLKNIN